MLLMRCAALRPPRLLKGGEHPRRSRSNEGATRIALGSGRFSLLSGGAKRDWQILPRSHPSGESCFVCFVRVGPHIYTILTRATLHHARSEWPGPLDVPGSSRASRGGLPTWQCLRCGRNCPCFRRVLQPNHTCMPRSSTRILSASEKPKGEELPIHSQDTT